jgi:prolyl-tRNA synthetase
MGSYGIGSSRVMGVIVEKFHDDNGILWPEQVAPFRVHIVDINDGEESEKLYRELTELEIEVLLDDRDASVGEKFSDADLIGNPIRLVVSKRNNGKIEWKNRSDSEGEMINRDEVISRLTK